MFTIEQLRALQYTDEQRRVIDDAVGAAVNDDEVQYIWSRELVEQGSRVFALFGGVARQVFPLRDCLSERGALIEWMPVVVDGRCLLQVPDDSYAADEGMLYLMRLTKTIGDGAAPAPWEPIYVARLPWLRVDQLKAAA